MTAGVQNLDAAAYSPAPPSTSTSDARGTGAAGKQPTDPQSSANPGQPSDFHSELALQQSGEQQTDPAGRTDRGKPGADKSGKKRNAPANDANPSAVTTVQVAESQKQILPLALTLPQTNEPVKSDEKGQTNESQDPISLTASDPLSSVAPGAQLAQLPLAQLPPTLALKPFSRLRQSGQTVEASPNKTAASNATPHTSVDPSTDSSKVQVVPLAPPPAPGQDIPVPLPQVPASPEQATKISKAELNLSDISPEPVSPAVQETVDSAPSSPSALAFAARFAAASQKTAEPVAANPSPSLAVAGSQPAAQIPVRYAATAQIIQNAALGNQQDGPKKDPGNSDERFARPDARNDVVLPPFETASEPAPSSASAAPQPAAPMARPESIIEPPAAPPTSSHDIRVQVPDNKGGSTQVRFVESGGEVRVSVRTADEGLAQNLRTHLNDLTQRLSDGGTPAEIWKPTSSATSAQNDQQQQQSQPDGRGSGGQGSGGQGGQQDRQQKRPAWLEEMEASLHGEQN
jgi:hypothetical protein